MRRGSARRTFWRVRRLDAAIAGLVAIGVAIQVFAGNGQIGTSVAGAKWLTVPLILAVSLPLAGAGAPRC